MKIQLHLVTLIMHDTVWYVVRLCMLRYNRIFIFTTGVPACTWSKQNLCAWEIRNGRWHVFLPVKSITLLQANCVMFQMFPVMAPETRIMTQEEKRRRSKRWWEEIRREEKREEKKKGYEQIREEEQETDRTLRDEISKKDERRQEQTNERRGIIQPENTR